MIFTLNIILFSFIGISLFAYYFQEKLIFYPEKLSKNYKFNFSWPFEEKFFEMKDGEIVHGLLFRTDNSKGLVFYLHGNAGNLSGWGSVYTQFIPYDLDVLVIDYRGYGKSGSEIRSEEQLHSDIKSIYQQMIAEYSEDKITVVGYSLGSGLAVRIAAENQPRRLILKAPFSNFNDLRKIHFAYIPAFLMKYNFISDKMIKKVKCETFIFHGDKDELIPLQIGKKLADSAEIEIDFTILSSQGHNGIGEHPGYQKKISEIMK